MKTSPEFPPIDAALANAWAAFLANAEQHTALCAQRDAVRAELDALEKSGQATEETASTIGKKRTVMELLERDIARNVAESAELQRAFTNAFHEFRRTSIAAVELFREAVGQEVAAAVRKAQEPFEAALKRASTFAFKHADSNYGTTNIAVLREHGPRLLAAWNELAKGEASS